MKLKTGLNKSTVVHRTKFHGLQIYDKLNWKHTINIMYIKKVQHPLGVTSVIKIKIFRPIRDGICELDAPWTGLSLVHCAQVLLPG
jgi:hypothetical protein